MIKRLSPRSWSLTTKFALTITAVVAGVAFTIGAVIVAQDSRQFYEELGANAVILARSVAVTSAKPVLRNDSWSLFKSLKKMTSGDILGGFKGAQIDTAMILAPNGTILAHMRPAEHPLGQLYKESMDEAGQTLLGRALATRKPVVLAGGNGNIGFLEGVAPIFSDEKFLGVVRVRLSTYEIFQKTLRSALIVLGLTFGMVLLGSLLGVLISRRITRPLTAMTEGLEAVSRGEFSTIAPIPVIDDDELGKLATAFNKMAAEMAEKKMLEEQIAVRDKLVALGRITAGVAHEVNNPLGGLLNCINTLKNHPEDPKIIERYLPLLDKGLHRIKDIVGSLLVELRVEDATEISDPSCLEELKGLIEVEIDGRDVNLIWDNCLADNVCFNGPRVQQIVHNLMKNSVDELPEGGTVSFCSFQDGTSMIFEVNDDGPGIPAEHRNHIFDPFFTTKPNGTGLGLWIVYRLVESMHGVISVESKVGHGTQFRITLPTMELDA